MIQDLNKVLLVLFQLLCLIFLFCSRLPFKTHSKRAALTNKWWVKISLFLNGYSPRNPTTSRIKTQKKAHGSDVVFLRWSFFKFYLVTVCSLLQISGRFSQRKIMTHQKQNKRSHACSQSHSHSSETRMLMFKISWTLCIVALHIHHKHGRTKSKPATHKEYNFRNQIHFGFGFFMEL